MVKRQKQKSGRDEIESELQDLRRRVALFDASQVFARVGHFEWNTKTRGFESCSAAFIEIVGVDRQVLLGGASGNDAILERIHPEDRQKIFKVFRDGR